MVKVARQHCKQQRSQHGRPGPDYVRLCAKGLDANKGPVTQAEISAAFAQEPPADEEDSGRSDVRAEAESAVPKRVGRHQVRKRPAMTRSSAKRQAASATASVQGHTVPQTEPSPGIPALDVQNVRRFLKYKTGAVGARLSVTVDGKTTNAGQRFLVLVRGATTLKSERLAQSPGYGLPAGEQGAVGRQWTPIFKAED